MCSDEVKKSINLDTGKLETVNWVPELKYGFNKSSTWVFKFIRVAPNVYFSSKNIGNQWFLTKTGDIVQFCYATKVQNSYFIAGTPIEDKRNFFTVPYSSSKTDIFVSNGVKCIEKMYHIAELKAKLMCLSYSDEYVFIPLLHTVDELEEYIFQ